MVSAAQKVKFLAPGREEYADYKPNSGSRTTTTIAHTLHIQTPPYTPQQPPSRRTISQNVPFSSKLESHTSCTFTDSKPWYGSHRSHSFSLSCKNTVLAHNSRDSTPKANQQTEVAFGTRCLVDNRPRAELRTDWASNCIVFSVRLHRSSSPQGDSSPRRAWRLSLWALSVASQTTQQPTSGRCPAACKDASDEA